MGNLRPQIGSVAEVIFTGDGRKADVSGRLRLFDEGVTGGAYVTMSNLQLYDFSDGGGGGMVLRSGARVDGESLTGTAPMLERFLIGCSGWRSVEPGA